MRRIVMLLGMLTGCVAQVNWKPCMINTECPGTSQCQDGICIETKVEQVPVPTKESIDPNRCAMGVLPASPLMTDWFPTLPIFTKKDGSPDGEAKLGWVELLQITGTAASECVPAVVPNLLFVVHYRDMRPANVQNCVGLCPTHFLLKDDMGAEIPLRIIDQGVGFVVLQTQIPYTLVPKREHGLVLSADASNASPEDWIQANLDSVVTWHTGDDVMRRTVSASVAGGTQRFRLTKPDPKDCTPMISRSTNSPDGALYGWQPNGAMLDTLWLDVAAPKGCNIEVDQLPLGVVYSDQKHSGWSPYTTYVFVDEGNESGLQVPTLVYGGGQGTRSWIFSAPLTIINGATRTLRMRIEVAGGKPLPTQGDTVQASTGTFLFWRVLGETKYRQSTIPGVDGTMRTFK